MAAQVPTLLLTRPKAAAERFWNGLPGALRQALNPVFSPMMEIVQTATALDVADARGLIFTSANGVAVAARLTENRDLPCYCVGAATTAAARNAGWQAECRGETSDQLVASLLAQVPATPLLHVRGRHARGSVADKLNAGECPTRSQIVYDQQLLALSETAQTALSGQNPVLAPLFSPRSARQFADCCQGKAPLYLIALSNAVAEPVRSLNARGLIVADSPDAEAMIRAIEYMANRVSRVESRRGAQ